MNKQRRAQIELARVNLEAVKGLAENALEAEQEAYDAIPEGLRESERGQQAETACSALEHAVDLLGEALDALEEAVAS